MSKFVTVATKVSTTGWITEHPTPTLSTISISSQYLKIHSINLRWKVWLFLGRTRNDPKTALMSRKISTCRETPDGMQMVGLRHCECHSGSKGSTAWALRFNRGLSPNVLAWSSVLQVANMSTSPDTDGCSVPSSVKRKPLGPVKPCS